jgi:sugar phosphate permease
VAGGLVQYLTARGLFYGWIIVAVLAVTETVSWGILYYAFSALLAPMQEDLGWSTATITGAYSVGLLVSGLAAPFVGRTIDRHGPRVIMTAGSILGVIAILMWSRVETIAGLYLVWIAAGLAMSATLYEPAFATVTAWFEHSRARAILVVTLFAGFASTIFLPLTAWLVGQSGWRDALVTLAVILGIVTILPHALLLRHRPVDAGLTDDANGGSPNWSIPTAATSLTLRDALRDRAFWWLAGAFSLETFSTIAVAVHMIPYLTERGDGAQFAATVAGLIGAAQVVARILATVVGGRLSEIHLTALVFGLQAVAISLLLLWQSTAGVLTAVLLFGAGRGVVTLMRAGLVANLFGRAHFGAISGSLALFLTGARSIAPVGAGVAYAIAGNYVPVLWGMAALSMAAALTMLPLDRLARVRGQVIAPPS